VSAASPQYPRIFDSLVSCRSGETLPGLESTAGVITSGWGGRSANPCSRPDDDDASIVKLGSLARNEDEIEGRSVDETVSARSCAGVVTTP
jgi:hypothetical protein